MQAFGWKSLDPTWNFDTDAPLFEDLRHNGKFCEHGLAFPVNQIEAKCSQVDRVEFNEDEYGDERLTRKSMMHSH